MITRRKRRRWLASLLTAAMVFTMLPSIAFAQIQPQAEVQTQAETQAQTQPFSDTAGHWAENAILIWAERGVLSGADGLFRPNASITRAELASVINRVVGYSGTTDTVFADVPAQAWYASDIQKLYAAGIMRGDGSGVMRPNDPITREEAVVLLANAFDIEENAGNISPFSDAGSISGWAGFLVDGMKAGGYISGDSNGNFNPKSNISRAETVAILNRLAGDFFHEKNTVRDDKARSSVPQNGVIRADGVMLQNYSAANNLYIMEGVGNGDVTLENINIDGTLHVRGGGANSVNVLGGRIGAIVLNSPFNTHVNLSNGAEVNTFHLLRSGSITLNGAGVAYDAEKGTLSLSGRLDKVVLNADGTAEITINGTTLYVAPENSASAGGIREIILNKDSVVNEMILNAPVNITGAGAAAKAAVNVNGVVFDKTVKIDMKNITTADGVTVMVAGKEYPKKTAVSEGGGGGGGSSNSDGTERSPYLIRSRADMEKIGTGSWGLDKHYKLMADINLGNSWLPIADGSSDEKRFTGTFDGNGKTLTVSGFAEPHNEDKHGYKDYGVFGYMGAGGEVKSLTVAGAVEINGATASMSIGGIAGYVNGGSIADCASRLDIDTSATEEYTVDAGGIAGFLYEGTVSSCSAAGGVTAFNDVSATAGGITGYSLRGTVSRCSATGNVAASGGIYTFLGASNNYAGGIVGWSDGGTVSSSYAAGDVSASDGHNNYAGGIVGFFQDGTVSNCYAAGAVTASPVKDSAAGGIAGYLSGRISACAALNTSVTCTNKGRIVGYNVGTLTNNKAIAIEGITAENNANDENGVTITEEAAKNPNTYIDMGWTFGDNSDNPWKMVTGKDYPLLWYQEGEAVPLPSGSGTEADPYLIRTADDMANIGTAEGWGLGQHYKLLADINLGYSWLPIADGSAEEKRFTGTFDGNGKTLTVNGFAEPHNNDTNFRKDYGVFGYMGTGGEVKNLTVAGAVEINDATESTNIGGIAGYVNGGSIADCVSELNIDASAAEELYVYVGGIAGFSYDGTVSNCYAAGAVTASGGKYASAGGIGGLSLEGTVSSCYAAGAVTAFGGTDNYAGGIVGFCINGTVSSSYSMGDVSASGGTHTCAGGIAGRLDNAEVSNSYAACAVTATGGAENTSAGGIVGHSFEGTVSSCYAACAVTASDGTNNYAGGIAGELDGTVNNIENCVALNTSVIGTTKGRIAGYVGDGTLTNNKAIAIDGIAAENNANGKDGETITEEAAKNASTYTGMGWKFGDNSDNPWKMVAGQAYPQLWYQEGIAAPIALETSMLLLEEALPEELALTNASQPEDAADDQNRTLYTVSASQNEVVIETTAAGELKSYALDTEGRWIYVKLAFNKTNPEYFADGEWVTFAEDGILALDADSLPVTEKFREADKPDTEMEITCSLALGEMPQDALAALASGFAASADTVTVPDTEAIVLADGKTAVSVSYAVTSGDLPAAGDWVQAGTAVSSLAADTEYTIWVRAAEVPYATAETTAGIGSIMTAPGEDEPEADEPEADEPEAGEPEAGEPEAGEPQDGEPEKGTPVE